MLPPVGARDPETEPAWLPAAGLPVAKEALCPVVQPRLGTVTHSACAHSGLTHLTTFDRSLCLRELSDPSLSPSSGRPEISDVFLL